MDCGPSAPSRFTSSRNIVNLGQYYFAAQGARYSIKPVFAGQQIGALTNEPRLSAVYLNTTTTSVQPCAVGDGETEASLRCVFAAARARAPCIIILDEVDAICPRRVDDAGGVEKRVVATLLTDMDGVDETGARILVVATTNRPNSINPALRRPGRFDR